ncbi:hypothetical protein OH76DRAFT_842980 [Lentinus brumalis]|uniref:Uncharacterized protein n=1 Tax=Lentinus brumalis TaxID=2498619 RepID=A0A371D1U1_9APHY|nr:hypothetical protein OH76DRAFT_842980 [Polyporus brumalis]
MPHVPRFMSRGAGAHRSTRYEVCTRRRTAYTRPKSSHAAYTYPISFLSTSFTGSSEDVRMLYAQSICDASRMPLYRLLSMMI